MEELRARWELFVRMDSPEGLCWTLLQLIPAVQANAGSFDEEAILKYRKRTNRVRAYHVFEIPKKRGGFRAIQAPDRELKTILRALNLALLLYFEVPAPVHGFSPGRSVVSGARQHVGKNYVFNIDLKDFFPSITARMVTESLRRIGIPFQTARFVADLCTIPGGRSRGLPDVLPQGAPTSPVLSNIVCARLDERISGLASSFGVTYTRYADDLSFSSQYNVYKEGEIFRELLKKIIEEEGFTMNDAKTHLMKKGARQEVTGVVVNEKANIPRRWIKNLRAEIHRMRKDGCTKEGWRSVQGKIHWIRQVRGYGDPKAMVLEKKLWQTRHHDRKERDILSDY